MNQQEIREAAEKRVKRDEALRHRRTTAKVGLTYYFSGGEFLGRQRRAAKFLPNLRGFRYEKGRLVPRNR